MRGSPELSIHHEDERGYGKLHGKELRWGTFQQTQASMPLSRLQQVNELSQIWHRRSRLGPYLTTVGVEACSSNRHFERFSSLVGYLAAAHSTYAEPSSSPTCCGVELHVFFSRRFSSLFRLGCSRCGTNFFFFFANSSATHETTSCTGLSSSWHTVACNQRIYLKSWKTETRTDQPSYELGW